MEERNIIEFLGVKGIDKELNSLVEWAHKNDFKWGTVSNNRIFLTRFRYMSSRVGRSTIRIDIDIKDKTFNGIVESPDFNEILDTLLEKVIGWDFDMELVGLITDIFNSEYELGVDASES